VLQLFPYSITAFAFLEYFYDEIQWRVRHVKHKDDNDWVKRRMTWEVEGIRQRGRLKKTWWDCVKNDMEV